MPCALLAARRLGAHITLFQLVYVFFVAVLVWEQLHGLAIEKKKKNVAFKAFIGFSVIFCIYEDTLKIFFNIFRKMSQKCEHISYELFVCDFLWFLGLPPPSPASMSKFPSRGKQYGKNVLLLNFMIFMEQIQKTKETWYWNDYVV